MGDSLKKFLALIASLLLVGAFATPAHSAGVKYTVYQKTLATFSSTATTLTSQQKAQVKATVDANPDAEKFICTGIRYYSQPMSVNIMVRKRAKEACAYAKQLNPELSTWYQNKPTQARSYAGKVLLTVKTPDQTEVVPTGICAEVEITEALESLCELANSEIARTAHAALLAKASKATGEKEVKVNLFLSPALESEREKFEKEAQEAIDFHGEDFGGSEIQVLMFTPDDGTWARQTWNEVSRGSIGDIVTIDNMIGGQALAKQHAGELRYYFTFVFDSPERSKGSAEFILHEFTHLVQHSYAKSFYYGWPQGNLPSWVNEGAATFVSTAPVSLSEAKQILFLRGFRPEIVEPIKSGGVDRIIQYYHELDTMVNTPEGAWKSYFFGGLASELITAAYGYDKLAEFQRTFADSANTSANFEKVFGFSIEIFYERAAEYVNSLVIEQAG